MNVNTLLHTHIHINTCIYSQTHTCTQRNIDYYTQPYANRYKYIHKQKYTHIIHTYTYTGTYKIYNKYAVMAKVDYKYVQG